MNREEYNACVAKGMTGKKLTREERNLEFCVVAKTCSGKAKSREDAIRLCSEPKPLDGRRRRRRGRSEEFTAPNIRKVATCVVKKLDPKGIPGELELANALSDCL